MQRPKLFPTLLIAVLAATLILTAYPANAAVPPAPSFTVQYADHSYDVPTTYKTDPYTGQTIVNQYGYHVTKRSIDVIITNPPFTPYLDSQNHTISLYYNIRSKGHYEDWNGEGSNRFGQNDIQASSGATTTVNFDLGNWQVNEGGSIDFQVESVLGYPATDANYCGSAHFTETDVSGWSATKTITIGEPIVATPTSPPYNGPTATPYFPQNTPLNPTAPPILPDGQLGGLFGLGSDMGQIALVVLAVVVVASVAAVIILLRKVAGNKPETSG